MAFATTGCGLRRRSLLSVLLVLILIPLVANCRREPTVSREKQLADALAQMRNGMTDYAKQQGRYPTSLEEMVAAGVLPAIPTDPLTGSRSTWRLVREERVAADALAPPGAAGSAAPVVDVRSGASGTDSSGVPWSEY